MVQGSPLLNGQGRSDSPRRQHAGQLKTDVDFEKAFEKLRLRDEEVRRRDAYNRKLQLEKVDEKESRLAADHAEALEQAKKKRDAIRDDAQSALARHEQEQEAELRHLAEVKRLRQQQEALKQAERDRKIQEEKDRLKRAEEEQARAEAERQRRERERAEEAERDRRRTQEEQRQEEQKRQREEAERQKADEEARIQAQHQAQQEAQQAQQAQQAADQRAKVVSASQPRAPEAEHKEYIELYLRTKKWKNEFWADLRAKSKELKNPAIKEFTSDIRKVCRSEPSKLSTSDKDSNRLATHKLKEKLSQALRSTAPVVGKHIPVNFFLPTSLKLNDNDETTITDHAAFFLCMFAQQIVKILVSYVIGEPKRAEPIGLMISTIFGNPQIQYERRGDSAMKQSLFPILLAKYHRVCPALFGITGDQTTSAGKLKMGWALQPAPDDNAPKTTFVGEQDHYDRMKGLAIGYASFALRNFSNQQAMSNPYPPINFWRSVAMINNLPPDQVQPTHVLVLRWMFGSGGIDRFLLFYGAVGVAVLREVFVEFPKKLPQKLQQDSFVKELLAYVESLAQQEHLHLA